MKLYKNELYLEDLKCTAHIDVPWHILEEKTFFISGATGMIGSFLVDTLMTKNEDGLGCTIYALSRNAGKAAARFSRWKDDPQLRLISCDINKPLVLDDVGTTDFVLHLASNTHPMQYSTDPIGTISTNMIGLQNMLEFAVKHKAARVIFASSCEIYGENRGDVDSFAEDYCGYINSNTMRAGYPESKRCGEALCQAYRAQKGIDVVIPRLTRSYGPTMLMSDTKAVSQFIRRAVDGQNIVLKSEGTQYYSYTYVADAVGGLLTVLLKGKNGEAYNVADRAYDIMLKDLAAIIAQAAGKEVVFELSDPVEAAGYSKATKARLDGRKLKALGWKTMFSLSKGIERTIQILSDITN